MAFFKFRKRGEDNTAAAPAQQTESIEVLRRRAKHRLIGSAVLVLIGVIVFPLLVDKQPRPIPVDIPIEIPDRNKVKPLGSAQPPSAELTRAAAMPADDKAEVADPVRSPAAAPPPAPPPGPVALPATSPGTAPAPAQEASPDKAAAAAKPANSGNDGLRAQALLEGKPSEDKAQPTEGGRFIVQVGAYADAAKAREVRLKMERGGIKTYTHVANTKDGQLTRVRVGPFASRSEAEQAAAKVKKLDLPASVLTL
ncbi:MAG: SPOR domain-containing protein [Hylemonella sp.]